jgi:hypothetical protein
MLSGGLRHKKDTQAVIAGKLGTNRGTVPRWFDEAYERVFTQILKGISGNRKFFIVQGNSGKLIDVVRRNHVFRAFKLEIPV